MNKAPPWRPKVGAKHWHNMWFRTSYLIKIWNELPCHPPWLFSSLMWFHVQILCDELHRWVEHPRKQPGPLSLCAPMSLSVPLSKQQDRIKWINVQNNLHAWNALAIIKQGLLCKHPLIINMVQGLLWKKKLKTFSWANIWCFWGTQRFNT